MNDGVSISAEEEVATVQMHKPHVVILGAGASRACCPTGDRSGKSLPLMADFSSKLGLEDLLNSWGIDPNQNFEDIFSKLYNQQEFGKTKELEGIIRSYFNSLELPDTPTIYDHLVLSLRKTDYIATFNWDPFLIQAVRRNGGSRFKAPNLLFLHGCVSVGFCKEHDQRGLSGGFCKICKSHYQESPLLYPIGNKDYAKNYFIASEWECLKWALKNAFMLTIFGYSGPKTDKAAIAAMKEAWGDVNQRYMEQTAFITLQSDDEITSNWQQFIHTHHYEIQNNFYDSWLAKHPRRTGEAHLNQFYEGKFISDNPIPKGLDFPNLWQWYQQFKRAELADDIAKSV